MKQINKISPFVQILFGLLLFFFIIFTQKFLAFDFLKDASSDELTKTIQNYKDKAYNYYLHDQSDSAYFYADEGIEFCRSNSEINQMIEIMFIKNEINSFYNEDKILELANLTMLLSTEQEYEEGIAKSHYYFGLFYYHQDSANAVNYFTKSMELAQKYNLPLLEAMSKQRIGYVYLYTLKDLSKCSKYFFEAKKIYDTISDRSNNNVILYNYSELLNSMGIMFKMKENYTEALKYYTEYSEIAEKLGEKWGQAISTNNIGIIYDKLNEPEKAKQNYHKSEELLLKLAKSENLLARVYHNLGNIYNAGGDYKKSDYYFEKSLQIFSASKMENGECRVLVSIAESLIKQGKYSQAEQNLLKSELIGKKVNDYEVVKSVYLNLSDLEEKRNNFAKALKYYKQYSAVKDSVDKINSSEEIGSIRTNYEMERKLEIEQRTAKEVEVKEAEKISKRNLMEYMIIITALLAIFAGIFVFKRMNISEKRIESMVFVAFLLAYEFLMILFEPEVNKLTNNEPLFSLLVYVALAIAFTPLDTYLETKLRNWEREKKKN